MDDGEDQIHRGVGSVCVAAASLKWSLAYCSSVLLCRGDDWFRQVAAKGKPIEEFRRLVNAIRVHEPAEYARAEKLLADAKRLLEGRHRVAHSVMIGELDPGSRIYRAWHSRSDDLWPVVPAKLDNLAREIRQCGHDVDAFGTEWEERADRGGWPVLD